ncbi:TPA: tail fiber assembly protein, partial [Escherichia coli]|nr:tail fiber assembly protein [Escherichia coli]
MLLNRVDTSVAPDI